MTKKALIVCGHGPGISNAVALKFGQQGHPVAIVARNADRLTNAADELAQAGVKAKAFPCDLSNLDGMRDLVRAVRAALGPVGVVHWNAYSSAAPDLTTTKLQDLRAALDLSVLGLVACVQAALPDLKAEKGAVLVTGGGLGMPDPKMDAIAAEWGSMGLAVCKAAQRKTVGVLHHKLLGDGVYVAEVVVMGLVKGTPHDKGNATIDPSTVADKFWELYQARKAASVTMS